MCKFCGVTYRVNGVVGFNYMIVDLKAGVLSTGLIEISAGLMFSWLFLQVKIAK